MNVFDKMVSKYQIATENDRRNAICEVMQEICLAGLYRSGFFNKAAFCGGTCLRIFHSLPRFSEDLDFSLLGQDKDFILEAYFPAIIVEFKAVGREIIISKKQKKGFGTIESAFLKDDTSTFDLAFSTEKNIKVKIELDIDPPQKFNTEQKLLLHPYSFMTRCFTLPDLFAGKMHALLFRKWKTRIKGRDWYDFEWYVREGVALNFNHFQARTKQFNNLEMSKEEFVILLKDKIVKADINLVKKEVEPFIKDNKSLEIWSNDYFLQLVGMMKIL